MVYSLFLYSFLTVIFFKKLCFSINKAIASLIFITQFSLSFTLLSLSLWLVITYAICFLLSVSNDDFKIYALLVWKKNDGKIRQHHNHVMVMFRATHSSSVIFCKAINDFLLTILLNN